MAFPLAAIGAGLGMGADAISRQNAQAIQNYIARLAAQRQLQQSQAEGLAGQILPALAGRLGGGNPLASLTQLSGNGSQTPPVPSSPIAQPSAAPMPQQGPMTGGTPTGVIPLDDSAASEASADDRARQLNVPLDSQPPPAPASPGQADVTSPVGGTPAPPAAGSSPTDTSGGAGQSVQAPLSNPLVQRLLGPTVNLKDISEAIQQARPGVDPGTAFRATQLVYDMLEKGNAAQQNNALHVLTQLRLTESLGEHVRHNIATEGLSATRAGTAQQQADTAAERARTSASQGQARLEQGSERLGMERQRLQQNDQRIREAKSSNGAGQKQRALRAVLQDIQKQLYPGLGMPQPDEGTSARLKNQELDVQNELRKMAGMPPVQMPPAAPAQPPQ